MKNPPLDPAMQDPHLFSTTPLWDLSAKLSSCLVSFLFVFSPMIGFSQDHPVLTIAAAADLTNVEPELARGFVKNGGKASIRWVTGASGSLAQQVENGAPYDVFLSANAEFLDQLASSRKIAPDSVLVYATGRVGVLWKDGKHHSLSDLTQSWVRFVAMPNPKLAPYGVAAIESLQHESLWQGLQPKVVYGENVRQTLQIFESGNAEAVLTADSLLMGKNADVLPDEWHKPIRQKGGMVADSKNRAAGQAFLTFLTSSAGQAVFAKFGFGRP